MWTIDFDLEREAGHPENHFAIDKESSSLDFDQVMLSINNSINQGPSSEAGGAGSPAREKFRKSLDRTDTTALRKSNLSGMSSRRSSKLTNQQTVVKTPPVESRETMKEMELFKH